MPTTQLWETATRAWPAWLLLSIITAPATATVYLVNEHESITAAVEQTVNGDTVIIENGVYSETVVLHGKTIALASRMLLDGDTTHRDLTVWSASLADPDTQSCVVYAYDELLEGRLYGLTLQNGFGTLQSTTGFREGGAVYITSEVTIEHCRIQNCSAFRGGGVSFVDPTRGISSRGVVRHCYVRQCQANNIGGGIRTIYCDLSINDCRFENNIAGYGGAALDMIAGAARVDSCIFRGNAAHTAAVGCDASPGVFSNCLFEGNGLAEGGICSDLILEGRGIYISRCIFRNNIPSGISVWMHTSSNRLPTFVGNVLDGNTTVELTGTIAMSNGDEGDVAYNLFLNNNNIGGGAVYCVDGTRVRIHHNWFEGNRSVDPEAGSVLLVIGNTYPQLDSNVIAGNFGAAVSWDVIGPEHPDVFAWDNWWGDASGPYHPTANPNGRGDTILQDSIRFVPWLTSPPDTTMPNVVNESPRAPTPSTWRIISLYPNPFNSQLTISLAGFAGPEFEVALYNLIGERVATLYHGIVTGGFISFTAPPSLSSGVYFARFSDRKFAETKKVMFLK